MHMMTTIPNTMSYKGGFWRRRMHMMTTIPNTMSYKGVLSLISVLFYVYLA